MIKPNKINITILSVSFRSGMHLNRLFNNLLNKSSNPETLKFLIVDNTNGEDEDLSNQLNSFHSIKFLKNSGAGMQRSISHAKALDLGLKNLDTDFCLIIDPDVHIFYSGWDRFCIDLISKEPKTVIGAPYPDWKLGKVHDFPSVVFMFFKTKQIKTLNKTFYPFPKTPKKILNSVLRKITRLGSFATKNRLSNNKRIRILALRLENIFGITSPDTGNEIIEHFRDVGYITINFQAVYSNNLEIDKNSALYRLANEYELYLYDGEPWLTHMYGSGVFYWKTNKGSDIEYWMELIKITESKLI